MLKQDLRHALPLLLVRRALRWLGNLDGSIAVVYPDAGPLSLWLHLALIEAGLGPVIRETLQVKKALKTMPIKMYRRDAERIARLLHLCWLRPVHCRSVSAQETRAVSGARKAINQKMIGLPRCFGLMVGGISRGRFEIRIR